MKPISASVAARTDRSFARNRIPIALAAALTVGTLATSSNAGIKLWDGDTTSTTTTPWSTAANWDANTAPANDTTTDIARFNLATYASRLPNADSRSIAGVQIGSASGTGAGATALTISGTGTGLTIGASGITMESGAAAATISSPLVLGAATQTWANNAATLLTISGATTFNGNSLTLSNTLSGGMTLTGAMAGGGGTLSAQNTGSGALVLGPATGLTNLVITTANTTAVRVGGNLTTTSGTLLQGGTLAGTNGIVLSGPLVFGSATTNGTLDLAGAAAFTVGSLSVNGAATAANQTIGNSSTATNSVLIVDTSTGSSSFGGIIKNTLGAGNKTLGLTKTGLNTLTLTSAANTYTGVTSGNRGTLEFVGAAAGGTQTVGALSVTTGGVNIQSTYGGAGNTLLQFGNGAALTHTLGSTVNFLFSGGTTATNQIKAFTTTTTANTITGPWITMGSGASTQYVIQNAGVIGGFTPAAAQQVTSANSLTVGSGALSNYDLTLSGNDTLSAPRMANTFRYFGGANTIDTNGNAFTLNGVMNNGTGLLTISSTGTGGVTIGNTNELVLNAANADIELAGPLNVSSGTAQTLTLAGPSKVLLNRVNNNGATTLTIANGSPTAGEVNIGSSQGLILNPTAAGGITVSAAIIDGPAGTGGVTATAPAAGIVTLSGLNTYSGPTTINNGVLSVNTVANVNQASAIGKGSAAGSPSDLVFGNGTLRYTGAVAGSTNREFTIGNGNGGNATLDHSGGTGVGLNFTSTTDTTFGTTGLHTLGFAGTGGTSVAATSTFAGKITDSGVGASNATSVSKTGASVWTLTNANTYTGATAVSAGTLRGTNANAFGTGRVTVSGTGQVFLDAGVNFASNDFDISSNGGILMQGLSSLDAAKTVTLLGNSRIGSTAATTATVVNVNSRIVGDFGLSLGTGGSGQGLLVVSNTTNAYQGGTTLAAEGSSDSATSSSSAYGMRLGNTDVLGTGPLTLSVGNRSTLTMSLDRYSETVNGLNSAGINSYFMRVIQNGHASIASTLEVGDGGGDGNYAGTIRDGAAGKLNFTKSGAGNQVLSGAFTYTGITTVNDGTLTVDFNQVGTAAAVAGVSTATNYLSANSDLQMNGGTLGIIGRGDSSFNGTKAATVTGNRTFQYTVGSTAGLVVGQLASNTGSVNVAAGAYIQRIDSENVLTMSAPITVSATTATLSFVPTSGPSSQTFKTITLNGDSALSATGGQVILGSTSGTIHATGASRTLTLKGAGTGDNTLTANITNGAAGVTSLNKSEAGVWKLTNADNDYTGTTTVSGGTLKLAAANNNIAASSSIIVGDTLANNSAKLDVTGITNGFVLGAETAQTLAGHGTIIGNVATASGSHLSPGNSIGTTSYSAGLSIGAGTILDYELAAPGSSDLTAVGGLLSLPTSEEAVHFNFEDEGGMTDGEYVLFTYDTFSGGATNFTETFVVDSSSLSGRSYTFVNDEDNNRIVLTVAAIPEPTSVAVLALGAMGLLTRKRRRI